MQTETKAVPHARITGLVVKEMGDEVMVYDTERNKAHCLNKTAALVWKYCDGSRTAADIAQKMAADMGAPVDQQVVWYALAQIDKYGLLSESAVVPAAYWQMSRRDFMKAVKVAAIVAVPIIISATAPTPAHALSCTKNSGEACQIGVDVCCPSVIICATGTCP
jgi:hypothetical protein